jgi:hypothetical protein
VKIDFVLIVAGERVDFLWCGGAPLSGTEKPEKSPVASDRARGKKGRFLREISPFWGWEKAPFLERAFA